MRFVCVLVLFLHMLVFLPSVSIAAAEDEFVITSSSLNADMDKAEICLDFSDPIDISDRNFIAQSLRLTKNGTKVDISPRDLSLTVNNLCIQQLEHRGRYRLSAGRLKSMEGKTLSGKTNFSFVVPDRKPSIAFEDSLLRGNLLRVGKTGKKQIPTIKAVNIKTAKLTLYRFSDSKQFAEAWAQAGQINLAPSESLYFASQKGQQVWQSDLVFGDKPNIMQTLETPLPSGDELKPGLYFLAAVPYSANSVMPAIITGQWLLVSDMRISAIPSSDGIYAFTADIAEGKPLAGIHLQLLTSEGQLLAEGDSGNDGSVFFAFSKDRKEKPAIITGIMANGEADIVDIGGIQTAFPASSKKAEIYVDREVYLPGDTVTAFLVAKNEKGYPDKIPESALKLVRPDQSFFSEKQISAQDAEPFFVSFPLPMTGEAGEWSLLWQRSDGVVLARSSLRIAPGGIWPKPEISVNQEKVDSDGSISLIIKSIDEKGKVLSWHGGSLEIWPARPEFPMWEGYYFGAEVQATTEPIVKKTFLTNEKGTASVNIKIPANNPAVQSSGVVLSVKMEKYYPTIKRILPVDRNQGWIGIKPWRKNGRFFENSVAAFDVIAVDSEGEKRAAGDLFYQVYEEGRSFHWFQSEGRWNYHPLPHRRRIGGGRIVINASGSGLIQWPVTAGHYSLEISGPSGELLAQYGFDAGGKRTGDGFSDDRLLSIQKIPSVLKMEKENTIKFKLAFPAMVGVFIGSGQTRQILHRFMPAGETEIVFKPGADWGAEGQIIAKASFVDGREALVSRSVAIDNEKMALSLLATPPKTATAGQEIILPVTVKNISDQKNTKVRAIIIPTTKEEKQIANVITTAASVGNDGAARLKFFLPEYSGKAEVKLVAWDGKQFVIGKTDLAVRQPITIKAFSPVYLVPGDKALFTVRIENNLAPEGLYNYELSTPETVRVADNAKGKVVLKHNQSATLRFELFANAGVWGDIKLDIKGPNNFFTRQKWPLVVYQDKAKDFLITEQYIESGKTVVFSPKKQKKITRDFILAAPFSLMNLPQLLHELLYYKPVTTEELAHWLEATRMWQKELEETEMTSALALKDARSRLLEQLEKRQNYDGGFPLWPSGGGSDLAATAAALQVLQDEKSTSVGAATRWLQGRLENTWFEESERPARAVALKALARVGQANLSSLRYFADTSRDKELAPHVMADIALALAFSGDKDATEFWLQKIRSALLRLIETNPPDVWFSLASLVANPLFNVRDGIDFVEKAQKSLRLKNLEQTVACLYAYKLLLQRHDPWNLVVNEKEKKLEGIFLETISENETGFVLRNYGKNKIYVLLVEKGEEKNASEDKKDIQPEASFSVERQLYRMDGTQIFEQEKLNRGETYLLVLYGSGKLEENFSQAPIIITIPPSYGFEIESLGKAGQQNYQFLWPWLSGPLVELEGFSRDEDTASFFIQPSREWMVICLLRVKNNGFYLLPEVTVNSFSGGKANVTQNKQAWIVQ